MNILNMKFANNIALKLFWIFLISTTVEAATTQNVSELIEQAHKHDNMYTLGPEASQQKAVSLYEKALAAEPDEQQRLHILYRMAQLYGSSYQLEKGEKPDFPKAISIYKKIIESYTPQEPLVYKAMSSLCDHYTTLRQFKTALKWSKKILEYDTDQIDKQIGDLERKKQLLYMHNQPQADSLTHQERREIIEQVKQQPSLKKSLDEIQRYQKTAVDQVTYSAILIDPHLALGELQAIIKKHEGSFIAERAVKRLKETMDKMPEIYAPQNDDPFSSSGPALRAADSVSTAHNKTDKNIQEKTNVTTEVTERTLSVEPNISEIPQKDKHVARDPRAPSLSSFSIFIIAAAGLIVLILAVLAIRKRTSF